MRESKMSLNCTQIRKSISFIIGLVALIALSLPSSYAKDAIKPITSPMAEPVPSIVQGSEYDTVTLYYVVQWNVATPSSDSDAIYVLYEMICRIPHGSPAAFNCSRQQTAFFFNGDRLPPYTVNEYDLLSGNLIWHNDNCNNSSYGSINGLSSSYAFRAGYFPENYAFSDICAGGYAIVPDGVSVTGGTSVYNSSPFVTWSVKLPEHNIYHSELSEPQSDRYNSYFILNDQLIWLSYRFNGLYSYTNDFEIESEVYNSSGSYSSSGSGSYAGSQNGYTENVSVPDGQVIGVNNATGQTELFAGSYQGFVIGNIDFTGVSQGVLSTNSNGNVTYNNKIVYPVSVSGLDYHTMFDVIARLDGQRSLTFSIQPNTSQLQGLIGDMDFYESRFSLSDGSYQYSNYRHYTGQNGYFTYTIQPQKTDIEDVRSYGMLFVNPNNIPVNLSDVIWEYDLEFVQWRDDMYLMLQQIYSALTGEEVTTQSYTQPSWNEDLSGAEPATRISQSEINSVFVGNFESIKPTPSAQAEIASWVNMFSIPKLIGACCFALAMGTIILTLGKKKSD